MVWIMDMDGNKYCWVPEFYRGEDVHASFGNKIALGGIEGDVTILELTPGGTR